jgi:homoserine kinase
MASAASSGSAGVLAYAPASIGNLAAGFDLLGAALAPINGSLLGDRVHLVPAAADSFQIEGPFAPDLAQESRPNLVLQTLALYREALVQQGNQLGPLAITLHKHLPVSSGLGSSASSIVATLAGLQSLCEDVLSTAELLNLAGHAEGVFSGGHHLDNVAPSLLGGLQLVVPGRSGHPATRRLPWPADLLLAVVHPQFQLATAESRRALPERPEWNAAVDYAGNLAGLVSALHSGDRGLLARCLRDPLVEVHRAPLVPGFRAAQSAALDLGALGCSLSGSGPSVFAVAEQEDQAAAITRAIQAAFAAVNLGSEAWVCLLDPDGARVISPGARTPSREAHP